MKKIMIGMAFVVLGVCAYAQNGLENIIVERYYVSNAADAAGSIGVLPVSSVTYRIYADMLPGYKFQAVYGVPGHTLILSTSTSFFNNEDRGATTPTYTKTQARGNTVMLDSWLTVGAACVGNFGILKSEDNVAAGGATVVNNTVPPILQNADTSAGIPLTTQDGLYAGTPEAVTMVGLTNVSNGDLSVLNATSQFGNLFLTSNGSWASLNGSFGPIPATNRVLLAQITTDGVFHYELNIQIGTPTGGTENYVALNPVGTEISIPSLLGTLGGSNVLPTVSITAPSNGAGFTTGNVVGIDATAADANGTVDSVEFFVNGVKVGVDNSAPYQTNWTSTAGTKNLTAVATDNNGGQTTSSFVTINVTNNIPPTVSITSPANGALFTAPAIVGITANSADADGTVDSVEFFVNGVKVGADNSAPYSFSWTSVIGPANLTAKATDNQGAVTTSGIVAISIANPNALPYKVSTSVNPCFQNSFCLSLEAVDPVSNVIGYDVVMQYDKNKVQPTGIIQVSNALINSAYTATANSIDTVQGLINISVYFNAFAPANASFAGTGNVFCVEFIKTANFLSVDTASFTIPFLQESYFIGVASKLADSGNYITYGSNTFNGSLRFWYDNNPIKYDPANPGQYLITNILGNDVTCANPSAAAVQPDLSGNFSYNVLDGPSINIQKDILGTTSVQPVVNGMDALLARKVVLSDLSFIPTVFQMIGMDVNTDGVISSGDISQMNQRAVLMIPEFRQAWNYNSSGVSNGQLSKDWLFTDINTLNTDLAYRISVTYPSNDGIGYSKYRVPVVPFCLPAPVVNIGSCAMISSETYKGVLLGDINGNYSAVGSNGSLRTGAGDKIVFDLSKAVNTNGYIDIPVSVFSDDVIQALDFSMQFNEAGLTFNAVTDHTTYLQELANFNTADRTIRFTSNSLQHYDIGKALVSVRFAGNVAQINQADLNSLEGYLNGERVLVEVKGAGSDISSDNHVSVYPNPASGMLNVEVTENATIQLIDIAGRQVIMQTNVNANQKQEINIQNIANGIYMMKIYNTDFVSTKKVVINNINDK